MQKKIILPMAAGILLLSCGVNKRNAHSSVAQATVPPPVTAPKDTTKKMKPYGEVITAKAITQTGLFKVHKVDERYYFELSNSLLQKDILVVNRISKGSAGVKIMGMFGYAGDEIGKNVIRFVKGSGTKIFIERVSFLEVANDSSANGLYRSVLNSTLQPIVATFDIKTISSDSSGYVIDITDYVNSDNDIFSFDKRLKKGFGVGALQSDKSFVASVRSFPLNTEIKTFRTYLILDQPVSYEMNTSLVLLPKDQMQPRYMDARVGYFSTGYLDYDEPQSMKVKSMITRWRLEPRPEDLERYRRGELVEPIKPIVFYIDPATPKKWVSYLIQGVNDWEKAFEKAGFKNAIYALEVPKSDTAWSLEDARHNVIVYKASHTQNASGPTISDPRTGEILESHINWYHNVQEILRDWYFIQASPLDARAQKMNFDDDLMGRLIRYVCTHEVGHTLGLQHNFAASSSVPVDSLRSKHYITRNGHTPSIMDYARFNYIAQPEDGIAADDLIPRIGVYDEWAIEWGYRSLPRFATTEEEKTYFNKWITESLSKEKRLFFEDNWTPDPRNQAEDLGDNAALAGSYGIKNLQRVLKNLDKWATPANSDYTEYKAMYNGVVRQYVNYVMHVQKSIGGMYFNPLTVEQKGEFIEFPSREKIKSALRFFNTEVFQTPYWLVDKKYFAQTGSATPLTVYKSQEWLLHFLLQARTWNMLLFNETTQPAGNSYSYEELLKDLESEIWKELKGHASIDMFRRNLQKIYIFKLIDNIRSQGTGDMAMLDMNTIVITHIKDLNDRIRRAIPQYKDYASRIHLEDLHSRLQAVIESQKRNYPEWPRSLGIPPPPQSFNNGIIGIKELLLEKTWNSKTCWQDDAIDEQQEKLLKSIIEQR